MSVLTPVFYWSQDHAVMKPQNSIWSYGMKRDLINIL